jgi:hypothetical protein
MNRIVLLLVLAIVLFLLGALCGMVDTEARLSTSYGCTRRKAEDRFGEYVVIRPTAAHWYIATVTPVVEEGR